MNPFRAFLFSFLGFSLSACLAQATAAEIPPTPLALATNTSQPEIRQTVTQAPAPLPAISCDEWQSWPVIPVVSARARDLYHEGQARGNQSHVFSKIGDGEISAEWFFTAFDLGEEYYDLGPYQSLSSVIANFEGSFGRTGVAAKRGFNTDRILDPASSVSAVCEAGESPLTCELRLRRPAFAILSLGTNQVWRPDQFERGMRQILDTLLTNNVVAILSTKGDNLEGGHRINHIIACLAQEYDLPLWNFWFAIQPLPNHGLQADLEHLTYGITDFADPRAMQSAWTIRNLTALQALEAVWRGVTEQP